jgi:predicted PurR-regulated permease PerM
MLSFYFVYDYTRVHNLFLSVFPSEEQASISTLLYSLSDVVGKYIRGNLAISCITFVTMCIVLSIVGIPYALLLALFASVFDLLPLVGAAIGAIPSLIIAFSISETTGLIVLLLHTVYQQIENAVISPLIYDKTLDVFPALGFLVVIVGGTLFGVLGAFLALPLAASIPALIAYRNEYDLRHR